MKDQRHARRTVLGVFRPAALALLAALIGSLGFLAAVGGEEQDAPADPSPSERQRLESEFGKLRAEGKLAEALAVAEELLELEREALGSDSREVYNTLYSIADLNERLARFDAALKIREGMLATQGKLHGRESWQAIDARILVDTTKRIAALPADKRRLYWSIGSLQAEEIRLMRGKEIRAAIAVSERILKIREDIIGTDHPDYTTSLNNLGYLHEWLKDLARAWHYHERAMKLRREHLGTDHPVYATSLMNVGRLYQALGERERAAELMREALKIRKDTSREYPHAYAASLQGYGFLLIEMREYAKAAQELDHAVQIQEQVGDTASDNHIQTLYTLGWARARGDDVVGAERDFSRAFEIARDTLGTDDPMYYQTLRGLAFGLQMAGRHDQAEKRYHEIGAYHEKRGEAAAFELAEHHSIFGGFYLWKGEPQEAAPHVAESLRRYRALFAENALLHAERELLARSPYYRAALDLFLSMTPHGAAGEVYGEVLATKGLLLTRQRWLRRHRSAPELAEDFGRLADATNRLATVVLAAPTAGDRAAWRLDIAGNTRERAALESQLGQRIAAVSRPALKTSEDVRAVLPRGAALVDFLGYDASTLPDNARKKHEMVRSLTAFVLSRDNRPVQIDLGPLEPIRAAIRAWRDGLVAGRTGEKARAGAGAELRRRIWDPLARHLAGVDTVLYSPDGDLGALPLEALPGTSKDSYLIDELSFSTVAVAQLLPDLIDRREAAGTAASAALVVGDIDYGGDPTGQLEFEPLTGTRRELRSIQALLRSRGAGVETLSRSQASEENLARAVQGKRFVHIATHGYFSVEEMFSARPARSLRPGVPRATDISSWHPGLLSGVALAGANVPRRYAGPSAPAPPDGILTALEVAELDLSSTDLVVLSACETGLGKSLAGEGLLGLQRAFQVAGARGVLASLWNVDDSATVLLMTRFYENLLGAFDGARPVGSRSYTRRAIPASDALREAKLWLRFVKPKDARKLLAIDSDVEWRKVVSSIRGGLGRPVGASTAPVTVADDALFQHPYYWAAWVLSGDIGLAVE